MTRGALAWWLSAALACGGPPAVEVIAAPTPAAAPRDAAGPAALADEGVAAPFDPAAELKAEPLPLADCASLAARAASSPPDAALLPWLCPEAQVSRGALRGALLLAGSPAEAAALAPRLTAAPELAGLARLAALARGGALPAEAPDPVTTPVSPIDDAVLAGVVRAIGAQTAPGLTHDQRTRAAAFLARAHNEALAQLGLPPGQPLPPFARLLAGRALHFGRSFCQMYWQRRVAGLEGIFAAAEGELLRVMLALEGSPHAGDDALLAVERQRARRHLQGGGVAERFKARGAAESPTDLLPLPHEFDRLLDHGMVELAIQRALFLAGEPPQPFGLAAMTELLREGLARRDLGEFEALLKQQIAEARALQPPPPEQGARALPARRPLAWPDAGKVADAAAGWLHAAEGAAGLARRHALGRALILLRERPDASRELIRRGATGAAMARSLLDLHDGEGLTWLRGATAAASGDAATRRAFALASRDAGLLPR